jgi:hypothetical protein
METKSAYTAFRHKAKTTWSSARRGLLSAANKPNIVVGGPPGFKGEPDIWAPEERVRPRRNSATGSIVVPQMRRASLPMRGRTRHDRARRSAT